MALSLKDVLNIQQQLRRFDPGHAADDAVATRNWTKLNSEKVVLYQEQSQKESRPFLLAWQTEWMVGKLATLGHGSTVSTDATFGTNKYGFQLVTMVCFDAFQNGIPCLWAIIERHEAVDLVTILTEVKKKVNAYRVDTLKSPDSWRPSCFLVDDAKEENIALREVFPDMPVNLCLWHVRQAWLKKLHSLVKDPFGKAEMNRTLGQIMYCTSDEDPWMLSREFMLKWKDEVSFIQYYERNWHNRTERWAKGFRAYAHANQDSQGSIERWHATLKQYLRGSRKVKSARRNGMKMALVSSQSRNLCFHEVNGWDKDICTCTCGSSIQGNVCKHQIKRLLFLGGFSEVDLQRRLGTHWGTISGGLENIDLNYLSTNAEVFGLDLPVQTLSSDSEDDDCVVLPTPYVASSRLPKQRTLGEFQKEVGNLYAQVSHSTYLCQQAFEFVVEAVGQALALKASSEMHNMVREDDIHPQPFVPLPGNDSSLKRRKDFMERFISKHRVQHKGQDRVEHDWTEINDDNRFEILPSQKMTMHEALDRATHESLDLNVSFNTTIQQSNGVPAAPSKRRTNRRAVQRLFKEQVGVDTQPPDVIIIE
ncbi:hypothetical protein R1sor_014748 [Riccia sorocarpa]|uniref:SWIM-type domain-containing protein n=1 Tax=Riccia sorocarpa TaxID=122646 RepID=A0ABD3HD51_9MARC